jgi:hypothetical protein
MTNGLQTFFKRELKINNFSKKPSVILKDLLLLSSTIYFPAFLLLQAIVGTLINDVTSPEARGLLL